MGSLTTNRVKVEDDGGSLGNQSRLDKIDKLRELGIDIPLPQLVAVGDQSSGKSSVLESLTGFSFPHAAGLCTRYATQITCRRESAKYTDIRIIPGPNTSAVHFQRLRSFHRRFLADQPVELAEIFEQANAEMGIRSIDNTEADASLSTFSEHILKVEICGPEETPLTVIDVPGIFRTATPGLTTESDIELVRNMVKRYMKDSRTIILAVVPCNVDIATQEILELAKAADPEGVRTMGILTKPDLAIERTTQQAVIDLVLGRRNDLKLGYHVLKNRDADDMGSSLAERNLKEKIFFAQDQWSAVANTGRTGVKALKYCVSGLLDTITKKEFPHVKAEISKRLRECRDEQQALGAPRSDNHAQRAYLGRLAANFQRLATCALDANYVHDKIFIQKPETKLITRIIELNEEFADTFWKKGHFRRFASQTGSDEENKIMARHGPEVLPAYDDYPELDGIITTVSYVCEEPKDDNIMEHIKSVYNNSRGAELGTFGGAVLGTIFKEQAKKWECLVLSHVSDAILLVHDAIVKLLQETITDETVRNAFWNDVLFEKLCNVYRRAMGHAQFLLDIELSTRPYTYNHYFSSNLEKQKLSRYEESFNRVAKTLGKLITKDGEPKAWERVQAITLDQFRGMAMDRSNAEQVHQDIHDILLSYYKVSRKRFVDAVCQQVIDHFLLGGGRGGTEEDKSPVKLFDPELVMALEDEDLENIAGEDVETKRQRAALTAEIKKLEDAVKVLRG